MAVFSANNRLLGQRCGENPMLNQPPLETKFVKMSQKASQTIDKTPERIQGMFGQIAATYDLLNHLLSLGLDFSWRRKTAKAVFRRLEQAALDERKRQTDLARQLPPSSQHDLSSCQPLTDSSIETISSGSASSPNKNSAQEGAPLPVKFAPQTIFRDSNSWELAPILDVATGTGDLAIELRKHLVRFQKRLDHFPTRLTPASETNAASSVMPQKTMEDLVSSSSCKILGVDFSLPMIQLANQKWEKRKTRLQKSSSMAKKTACLSQTANSCPSSQPKKTALSNQAPQAARASDKKDERGFASDIFFTWGDGLNLEWPANTFSAVTMSFGLRNMVDPDRGISEMVRVCRPNGVVAILEFTMPTLPIFSALYRGYFRTFLPWLGEKISRNRETAYQYLPQSISEFDQAGQVCQRLQKAGLTDIQVRAMTLGTVTLYLGRKPMLNP